MSIPDNGLPGIDASVQDLDMATRFAWDAIRQRNFEEPFLFRRGGIVRIENDDDGRPIIREVTADRMRFELAKSAHYYRQGPQGQVPAHPPMANVKNMLADPIPPVPVLGRVTEVPVFGREGTLQTKPGYHPGTKNYYAPAPGFEVPAIPDRPTNDDMVRALQFIVHDLLGDFPFTGESERAHAVALYLLPYVRDLIDGPTPHHLVEKPCPGSGASLLVDALTFPVMGRSIAALTEGRDEDEWRKRLTSKISTGSPYILIDNLRRTLDSAAVSSAITCMSWEDRRLGSTEMVTFPVRCAWISTGNNPALSAEISRRTIRIRIDARIDRPWLRNGFRHPDLRGWVKEYRKDLVWAALVLIQRWLS